MVASIERRQQAILADLMQAEDKQKASFAKKAARKASKVKVPTMNASLPTEKPDEDAQAPAVLAMAPAAAGVTPCDTTVEHSALTCAGSVWYQVMVFKSKKDDQRVCEKETLLHINAWASILSTQTKAHTRSSSSPRPLLCLQLRYRHCRASSCNVEARG